jgi:hypothetical protein
MTHAINTYVANPNLDGFVTAQFVVKAGALLNSNYLGGGTGGADTVSFLTGENRLSRPIAGGKVGAGALKPPTK